jgi:hypothetical protein
MTAVPPPTAEQVLILAAFSIALGWLWYWHIGNMGRLRRSSLPLWVKVFWNLVAGFLLFLLTLAAMHAELVLLAHAAGS